MLDELLQVLPLYRELGFFSGLSDLTDAGLAEHLRHQYCTVAAPGFELRTSFPGWDIALLAMDDDRAWWYDSECVFKDDKVYAQLIERLGRISRGTFQPTDVEEEWEGDFGPIHIRFRVQGEQHKIDLGEMATDFMELGVLEYLSALIKASTPYQVVRLSTGDQTEFIVMLSADERERLKRERPALFDFGDEYGPGPRSH